MGEEGLPLEVTLDEPYPNSTRASMTLRYGLPKAAHVSITVYDIGGREVAVESEGPVEAGRHKALFDAAGLPSGTYLVRMSTEGAFGATFAQTQRVTLVR